MDNPAPMLYKGHFVTLPSTSLLVHNTHSHSFAMQTPSIYLRTPDATPGSFVKILWDFTCSTMSAIHPPQYELLKSRITPSTSKYWAVVHIPPAYPNQDPTEVSFVGKSMPTPHMAIEALRTRRSLVFDSRYPMPANEGIITFRVVHHPEK